MDSKQNIPEYRHFDPSDPISAKGKFAFDLNADGWFTVCREFAEHNLKARSESSSMDANLSTIHHAESIASDDVGGWSATTELYQKIPLRSLEISQKSQLFEGIGYWLDLEGAPVFPWRLEAVNLNDLELELDTPTYTSKFHKIENTSGLHNVSSSSSSIRWVPNKFPLSIAGSSSTIPPLTEDCSRDSDSIAISEPLHCRDEAISSSLLQTAFATVFPEKKVPLSPDLGSIGAGFASWFSPFDDLVDNAQPSLDGEGTIVGLETEHSGQEPLVLGNESIECDEDILEEFGATFSDSESTDSESIWMSDYSEGVPILEDDHPFLLVKPTVVRDALFAYQAWKQSAADAPHSTGSEKTPAAKGREQSPGYPSKRRKREAGDGSDEDGGSQDGKGAPEKRSRTSKKASGQHLSLACPFTKKDPVEHRSCYAFVMKRIGDVKQHLSRFHQLPIYCPRCMSTFGTEHERDDHIRDLSCQAQDRVSYEGITRAQKSQLAQRVSSKMTLEDQWFTVFDILFPGHKPRPKSAFINFELTADLEGFLDLIHIEGPSIILAAIRASGIRVTTLANEERDLSALLQSAIEEGLQAIAHRWSENFALDPAGPQDRFSEDPTSSLLSQNFGGSHESRASSDTLVDQLRGVHTTDQITKTTEQNQDVESQEGQRTDDAGHIVEDEQQVQTRQNEGPLISEDLNLGTGFFNNLYDGEMNDGDEFWSRVGEGDLYDG